MIHTNFNCISINGFSVSPLHPMLINLRPSLSGLKSLRPLGSSFFNKSENLHVILLLHRKHCSISIAVSWEEFFKYLLNYSLLPFLIKNQLHLYKLEFLFLEDNICWYGSIRLSSFQKIIMWNTLWRLMLVILKKLTWPSNYKQNFLDQWNYICIQRNLCHQFI